MYRVNPTVNSRMGTDWTIYALILYYKIMFLFANSLQLAYKPLKIRTKVEEIFNNWKRSSTIYKGEPNESLNEPWAFYGITLYKNKIFLSLDLLKLIHYFHKFPPLPSWDINHKLYPLLSYRYTFLCHYFPHNYTALEYHWEGQSDLHWTEAWHLQFFSGSQLDHSHFHIFMIIKQSECFSDHLKKTSSNAHRWCLMFEVNYLAPHLNFFSFHGIVR